MDIATFKSSYDAALSAYEVSITKINSWRKRNSIVLFLGMVTIVLVLLGRSLFFSPLQKEVNFNEGDFFSSVRHTHSFWENFEITGFCIIGAITCGFLGRRVRAYNDLPVTPKTQSEQDYELAQKKAIEEIGENNTLITQQKRLA